MILKNKRIELRYFTKEDFDIYKRLEQQDFYQRYEKDTIPTDRELEEDFRKIVESNKEYGYHKFYIYDHVRQVVVGDIITWRISEELKQWEIGWGLFESESKKGYVTEAAHLLMNYLFEELHIYKLLAYTHANNKDSRRVMQRLCMSQEGILRHDRKLNGVYYDNLAFGLLRHEYYSNKAIASSETKFKLLPVDVENFEECVDLKVHDDQKAFVAPNWYSLIQANYLEEMYPLAIYYDDKMIGFLMVCLDPDTKRWELCRLMIDHKYQSKGYGRTIMGLLLDRMRLFIGNSDFYLSVEAENTVATKFYESLGFKTTGEIAYDEAVMTLSLNDIHHQ